MRINFFYQDSLQITLNVKVDEPFILSVCDIGLNFVQGSINEQIRLKKEDVYSLLLNVDTAIRNNEPFVEIYL